MLECDLRQEQAAIPVLKDGIACCEQHNDYVSRALFEKIFAAEDEHIEWLETQLALIERVGLQNYQQSMI